jgi:chromosome partitioning protein
MVRRIVVLNPKGGSGKTTVAINLAAYYAVQGRNTVLMDYDPQASSTRWLTKRPANLPVIQGIAAFEKNSRVTRSFQLRLPHDADCVVVDTPAAVSAPDMPELVKDSHAILVPVLPSDIDIHACSKCISDLLLVAKVRRSENRIGVIANRARRNTLALGALLRFLATLGIPVITTLRDSQNYLRAAESGHGIHEMKTYLAREDLDSWQPLIAWLEERTGGAPAAPGSKPPPDQALGSLPGSQLMRIFSAQLL